MAKDFRLINVTDHSGSLEESLWQKVNQGFTELAIKDNTVLVVGVKGKSYKHTNQEWEQATQSLKSAPPFNKIKVGLCNLISALPSPRGFIPLLMKYSSSFTLKIFNKTLSMGLRKRASKA